MHCGSWRLLHAEGTSGVLVAAYLQDTPGAPPAVDILQVALTQEGLLLGQQLFQPGEPDDALPAPQSARVLAEMPAGAERGLSLWRRLTSTPWHQNEKSSASYPTTISLNRNGTFRAKYGAPPCGFSGTWSLLGATADTGRLRLGIPDHSCGGGQRVSGFLREVPVARTAAGVRLHRTEYLPRSPGSGDS